MKTRAFATLVGIGGALIASSVASASYQGLTVTFHTVTPINGINRQVFRVYALCSDPGDYISAVAGSPTLGNMTIFTRNSIGTGPGGNFVNPAGGSATAPTFKVLGTQLEWDTFVDIGLASVPYAGTDATGLSPGFSGIPSVSTFSSNNAGWFTAGPQPQGMAGNGIPNLVGSGNWGVLIMQLTVNAGNHIAGTVAIGGVNNNPLAGGTTFLTQADQTFESPTPGALPLFALAAMVGRRRRSN